jgi:RNA polymerase sigma-70 factor (ECF subfamily)
MAASKQPVSAPAQKSGALVSELYSKTRAQEFGIPSAEFVEILESVVAKWSASVSEREQREFLLRLHLDDLVLAHACARGNQPAWDVFMSQFREKLYDYARQITREDSTGRELADSLYAELYGTQIREGRRVSKLTSYSGRGSLAGWLRTVLAQEYVNRYRKQRRLVSLDRECEEGAQFPAPTAAPVALADERLEYAVDQALSSLEPEDRFILASYFLDDRTLAEIARSLSVHESTISRKVEKLTKIVRKQVLKSLAAQGMSRRQAEEALATDVRDLRVDIRASLSQDSVARAFSNKGADARDGSR